MLVFSAFFRSLALGLALAQGITSADAPKPEPLPPLDAEAGPGTVRPTYLSLAPNLNDFVAFAEGGWDGNWYVGSNSCWIVKLPPVPEGPWAKAYLGAKLGRAKTRTRPGGGFEQEVIPGKIYMGVSPRPAFPANRTFFLVETADLPLQPDPNLISPFVGHDGWFWTEVPVALLSAREPNYLAVWSNAEELVSVASAPVIAAAMTAQSVDAWLNRSIEGVAPREEETALETRLSRLIPALAVRLVPPNAGKVSIRGFRAESLGGTLVASFAAEGENVERAWLEMSYDRLSWQRLGPVLRRPPFAFSVPPALLGARPVFLRGAAADELGNEGLGAPLRVGR